MKSQLSGGALHCAGHRPVGYRSPGKRRTGGHRHRNHARRANALQWARFRIFHTGQIDGRLYRRGECRRRWNRLGAWSSRMACFSCLDRWGQHRHQPFRNISMQKRCCSYSCKAEPAGGTIPIISHGQCLRCRVPMRKHGHTRSTFWRRGPKRKSRCFVRMMILARSFSRALGTD